MTFWSWKAVGLQKAGGDGGPVTTAAQHRDGLFPRDFRETGGQRWQWDVLGPSMCFFLPLAWRADVEDERRTAQPKPALEIADAELGKLAIACRSSAST